VEPATLRLGELTVRGPDIRFSRGPGELRARPGDADIGILVRYEEDSPLKEHTKVRLAVALGGKALAPVEHVLRDRPLVHDVEQVWLAQRVPVAAGALQGTFEVHCAYARGPWAARETERYEFVDRGQFRLHVA
jgi:hypothetical protein